MLLVACVITHIVDVVNHTDFSARLHIRIMAITVILIWLRLMKNARAFSALGKRIFTGQLIPNHKIKLLIRDYWRLQTPVSMYVTSRRHDITPTL